MVDVGLENHVVDRRDRQQQARRGSAAAASISAPRSLRQRLAPRAVAATPAGDPIDRRSLVRAGGVAHDYRREERSGLVDDEQTPARTSVAASRRRSRVTTASGSGQRMYQASSQVLVTVIASSAQPEAATQS